MAIFGTLATVRRQAAPLPWLRPAFDYLGQLFNAGSEARQKMKALGIGETFRRELVEGTFALEQVYLTRPRAQGVWETHRKYVDVQVVFEGEEMMGVANPATLTVREDYNSERDAIFYHDAGPVSLLHFRAGDAAIYFPEDAHQSCLEIAGPQLVRKVVLKVPAPTT